MVMIADRWYEGIMGKMGRGTFNWEGGERFTQGKGEDNEIYNTKDVWKSNRETFYRLT